MSQVYKYRTIINSSGGSGSTNTNRVAHGLLKQIYIQALSSGTIFRATITDEDSDVIRSYDWTRDQINDDTVSIPSVGVYTISITNASQDTPFRCKFMVRE